MQALIYALFNNNVTVQYIKMTNVVDKRLFW